MARKKAISICVAMLLFGVALLDYLTPAAPIVTQAVVTRIVDGDTIVVEGGDVVRLLYIDTPERGQPCSQNATERLRELVDGKEVTLESGQENRDVYDRLLRYVFVNDTLVNLVLVREGWANLYVVERGVYDESFIAAEQSAKKDGLCVWSS